MNMGRARRRIETEKASCRARHEPEAQADEAKRQARCNGEALEPAPPHVRLHGCPGERPRGSISLFSASRRVSHRWPAGSFRLEIRLSNTGANLGQCLADVGQIRRESDGCGFWASLRRWRKRRRPGHCLPRPPLIVEIGRCLFGGFLGATAAASGSARAIIRT